MWQPSRNNERQISAVLIKHDSNLLLHRLPSLPPGMSLLVGLWISPPPPPLFSFPIRHFSSPQKLQTAVPTWTGQCSSLWNQREYSMCRKGQATTRAHTHTDTHSLSWTNGVASLQTESHCGCHGDETMCKWIWSPFRVKGRTALDDFVMISSPSRAVWRALSPFWLTHLFWMCFRCLLNTQKWCQNTTNESSNNANPLNVWSLLIFWGVIQNSLLFQTKIY